MTIITILICIALQKFANVGGWFSLAWFEAYLKLLRPWLKKINEWLGLLLIVAPICVVLILLHYLLMWKMFGIFDLLLVVIVMFFAMDARDFKYELAKYFVCVEKKDATGAANAVSEFLNNAPTNMIELNRAVTKAIAWQSFTRLFSVVFWFAIFNVYGAVIYFVISLVHRTALKVDTHFAGLAKVAAQVQDILDWLPVRVLGFSYVLAGKFSKVFNCWFKGLFTPPKANQSLIIETSLAAIDVDIKEESIASSLKENYEALDLINRVLIIWVIAVALFSLGTWL
jgi:AmpE protein